MTDDIRKEAFTIRGFAEAYSVPIRSLYRRLRRHPLRPSGRGTRHPGRGLEAVGLFTDDAGGACAEAALIRERRSRIPPARPASTAAGVDAAAAGFPKPPADVLHRPAPSEAT